jgi:L-fucose mutarotase/ribose pyranase (RbsD/FucU family)
MSNAAPSAKTDWERQLTAFLPLFGHRNWIVIADSAYPFQSRPGIETIVADADQLHVVRTVMDAIASSRHIRANVYKDTELAFIEENDAPGVAEYRRLLDAMLYGSSVNTIPHEQIIDKLDQSALLFRILVIKTDMTIPYTSVFIQLDCGYWSADAEWRLHQSMQAAAADDPANHSDADGARPLFPESNIALEG